MHNFTNLFYIQIYAHMGPELSSVQALQVVFIYDDETMGEIVIDPISFDKKVVQKQAWWCLV